MGGGCCCLIARTFAEEFWGLLKGTRDMEGNVQPVGDRVEAHTKLHKNKRAVYSKRNVEFGS